MREYESPNAEFIVFDNDRMETSGGCRCYLDIGVKLDYGAAGSNCWTDSEDATEYDVHDAPIN